LVLNVGLRVAAAAAGEQQQRQEHSDSE